MSGHKLLATLLVASLACAGTALEEDGSGIDGTVLRGPIQPVCTVGVPCDAPFAALFHVTKRRARGGTIQKRRGRPLHHRTPRRRLHHRTRCERPAHVPNLTGPCRPG